MKLLRETALGGLLVMACAGCPGTIEDRASFEELGNVSRADSGSSPNVDAAVPAQDAGLDASEAAVEDAGSSSQEPDAAEDSGRTEPDGGPAPDAATDAGESDASLGCDFAAVIKKCDGCHAGPPSPNPLDLLSPDLAGRLADRRGTGACSSYLLIDPERPEQSALYLKVTTGACGERDQRMPIGAVLTDGEQACILRWIESL